MTFPANSDLKPVRTLAHSDRFNCPRSELTTVEVNLGLNYPRSELAKIGLNYARFELAKVRHVHTDLFYDVGNLMP